ncbi:MAG: hypothetical protein Q7S66_02090 [bacterium]|nr:hypothetical protein [bacterium]
MLFHVLEIKVADLKLNLQDCGSPSASPNFTDTSNITEYFNLKSLSPPLEKQIDGQLERVDRLSTIFNKSFNFIRYNISVENKLKAKIDYTLVSQPNSIIPGHIFPTKISCENVINYRSIKLEEKLSGIGQEFTTCMNQGIAARNDTDKNILVQGDIIINGIVRLKFSPDPLSLVACYALSVLIWSGIVVWFDKIFYNYVIKIFNKLTINPIK